MRARGAVTRSRSTAARVGRVPAKPAGARKRAPALPDRQAQLLAFLSDPPPEIVTAAEAVGRARELYGDDTDRELADIQAGRHPLQRRTKTRG